MGAPGAPSTPSGTAPRLSAPTRSPARSGCTGTATGPSTSRSSSGSSRRAPRSSPPRGAPEARAERRRQHRGAAPPARGRDDFEAFQQLLRREDDQLWALPATAQVAKQEAEYLAQSFDSMGGDAEKLRQTPTKFTYAHKGSLAYIGADAAVLDIPGMGVIRGLAAGFIWKSFETFSQFSIRNQILVLSDSSGPRSSGGTPAPSRRRRRPALAGRESALQGLAPCLAP